MSKQTTNRIRSGGYDDEYADKIDVDRAADDNDDDNGYENIMSQMNENGESDRGEMMDVDGTRRIDNANFDMSMQQQQQPEFMDIRGMMRSSRKKPTHKKEEPLVSLTETQISQIDNSR